MSQAQTTEQPDKPTYRYITIPPAVEFKDPDTKEPIEGSRPATFWSFMFALFQNPIWKDSYAGVVACQSILTALDTAGVTGAKLMVLPEASWEKLVDAVNNPRQLIVTVMGPKVEPGYGWMPVHTPQLLPFMDAILGAPKKSPVELVEEAA